MENDIWHTFEKQGGKVLHTLRTRRKDVAQAMLAAPELLEALEGSLKLQVRAWNALKATKAFDPENPAQKEFEAVIAKNQNALAKAKGE